MTFISVGCAACLNIDSGQGFVNEVDALKTNRQFTLHWIFPQSLVNEVKFPSFYHVQTKVQVPLHFRCNESVACPKENFATILTL